MRLKCRFSLRWLQTSLCVESFSESKWTFFAKSEVSGRLLQHHLPGLRWSVVRGVVASRETWWCRWCVVFQDYTFTRSVSNSAHRWIQRVWPQHCDLCSHKSKESQKHVGWLNMRRSWVIHRPGWKSRVLIRLVYRRQTSICSPKQLFAHSLT